jgi:hypothetical protein
MAVVGVSNVEGTLQNQDNVISVKTRAGATAFYDQGRNHLHDFY